MRTNLLLLLGACASAVVLSGVVLSCASRASAADVAAALAYDAPDGIHLIRADGTGDHRLPASRPGDIDAAWSPDGRRLSVITSRDGHIFGRLVILDLATRRRITLAKAGSRAQVPTWSADGSTIYFNDAITNTLFSIHPDGTGLARPLGTRTGFYPAAGPNGSVAYTNYDYDQSGIFVFSPGDTPPGRPVIYQDTWGPAWWPDGNSLIYMGEVPQVVGGDGSELSRVEIYRISADGLSDPVRLTNNNVWDGDPNVSPDGSLIAFDTGRYGWDEIEVMNADGSNHRRLTYERDGDADAPAWRPASVGA